MRLQAAGNLGSYNHACKACELDLRYVLREDVVPSDIASTIVHEGTHARLEPLGYSERLRERIEAACRSQERAFAERLPQVEGDRIRAKVGLWDNVTADFWSDAAGERQLRKGIPAALEYVGLPTWLVPILIFGRRAVAAVRRVAGVLTSAWSRRGARG